MVKLRDKNDKVKEILFFWPAINALLNMVKLEKIHYYNYKYNSIRRCQIRICVALNSTKVVVMNHKSLTITKQSVAIVK